MLDDNCNKFFTSFVRSRSYFYFFYLVFKTFVLKRLRVISFWSEKNNERLCVMEIRLFK